MGKYTKVDKKYYEIQRDQRIGETNITHQGRKITIVEYYSATDIVVEFEDGFRKHTAYTNFKRGNIKYPNTKTIRKKPLEEDRKSMRVISNEGFEMLIAVYNSSADIIVEFVDEFHTQVHTAYKCFRKGEVKNPNIRGKYGEITGDKYPTKIGNKRLKEYQAWRGILVRAFDSDKHKITEKCYKNVTVCDEWLYYPNFYEWLHSQENFDKWLNDETHIWDIDKDILSDPDNKIYSPDTCCLVPSYVNRGITRRIGNIRKYDLPTGVNQRESYYYYIDANQKRIKYSTIKEAEEGYIKYKKDRMKELADKAIENGDITKRCYEGLMNYKYFIEIKE